MTTVSDHPEDPHLGRRLANKFELTELLGVGGMGRVYKARHLILGKDVAIKVLMEHEEDAGKRVARFRREAKAASQLEHENSVRILDYGQESDGLFYIVMEFIDGEDLRTLLQREGRLTIDHVVSIMSQVLSVLAEAHEKGIVHRDLKPGNIMLIKRRDDLGVEHEIVKVCDFGLAKLVDPSASDSESMAEQLTRTGVFVGTPAYMSPEQAQGEELDGRSDIYSCGVIMYRMLGGKAPFSGKNAFNVLMKHVSENPQPLLELVPDLDPRMDAMVAWALAKNRNARCPTARDLQRSLLTLLNSGRRKGPLARPSTPGFHGRAPTAAPNFLDGALGSTPTEKPQTRLLGVANARASSPLPGPMPLPPASERQLPELLQDAFATPKPKDPAPAAGLPLSPAVLGLITILVLLLAGLGVVASEKPRARSTLAESVRAGRFDHAENEFLKSYDLLAEDLESIALAKQALARRRVRTTPAFRYLPAYELRPSIWSGTVDRPGFGRQLFRLSITNVTQSTFRGHTDWPDQNLRVAIRGFHDANHLIWTETHPLVGNPGRHVFNRKKVGYLKDGMLRGMEASSGGLMEAKRAD